MDDHEDIPPMIPVDWPVMWAVFIALWAFAITSTLVALALEEAGVLDELLGV